jgi:hypothetical protein
MRCAGVRLGHDAADVYVAVLCVAGEGVPGMDPVTIGAVLVAIAGGAGSELAGQLWAGVSALVRRPFRRHAPAGGGAAALPAGDAELVALVQAPADERRAVAVAEVLVARAGSDAEFRRALEGWWEQAGPVRTGAGDVTSMISGGTQHGPVLQGRDFSNITFGAAPAVPPVLPLPDQGT